MSQEPFYEDSECEWEYLLCHGHQISNILGFSQSSLKTKFLQMLHVRERAKLGILSLLKATRLSSKTVPAAKALNISLFCDRIERWVS